MATARTPRSQSAMPTYARSADAVWQANQWGAGMVPCQRTLGKSSKGALACLAAMHLSLAGWHAIGLRIRYWSRLHRKTDLQHVPCVAYSMVPGQLRCKLRAGVHG